MDRSIGNKPIVSIIIPVYNTEKYIRKCLDSIIAQTYTNWEAILVNDGSTDSSGAICDKYANKDTRFKVIHQKNSGVVNARNTAISVAKGDYIAFADSDDSMEENMLELLAQKALKEDLDIAWCNIKEIYKEHIEHNCIKLSENNHTNIRNLLRNILPGYIWNKLIKKDFWESCNINTDDDAVMCEDTYITLQLLAHNPKNGHIKNTLYLYNKTNDNATTKINENSIIIKAEKNIINIYEYLKSHDLLQTFHNDFANMALKLKIELLRYNIRKAMRLFPSAHKNYRNFTFTPLVSFYYWFSFNTGFVGYLLFKLRF